MTAVVDMPTAELLAVAQNTTAGLMRHIEGNPGDPKRIDPQTISAIFFLPMSVTFIRELERRGIDTGHAWLVEIYDEEMEALRHEQD